MVLDGTLHDFKSTSTFSYTKGSKDEDYRLQGSIYRWLNQDKITDDHMYIEFIFTDWMKARAKADLDYPQTRVYSYRIDLYSIEEIEAWMTAKIREFEAAADLSEDEIPHCTDKELWMDAPIYKYFANPAKTDGRSTKNFTTLHEANAHLATAGKGVVITVPGTPKACAYCSAFPLCSQKDLYSYD